MAAMFWAMVWHARRRMAAVPSGPGSARRTSGCWRRSASSCRTRRTSCRTPITIALGHAELLARHLAGRQDRRDIHVVVGELDRLRGAERAAAADRRGRDPDFLQPEPVDLDMFLRELFRALAADRRRRWQLGRWTPATVQADAERLGAGPGRAAGERGPAHRGGQPDPAVPGMRPVGSVGGDRDRGRRRGDRASRAGRHLRAVPHRAGRGAAGGSDDSAAEDGGTGLGLALVESVARGHRGEVLVQSEVGVGSRFELVLPAVAVPGADAGPEPGTAGPGQASLATPRSAGVGL